MKLTQTLYFLLRLITRVKSWIDCAFHSLKVLVIFAQSTEVLVEFCVKATSSEMYFQIANEDN